VIVAAGAWPETALATATGLRIGSGIVVDDRLTTSDPAIRAIGDCAEHDGVAAGLVQPAWEQATVLAGLLTGAEPGARYRGTPTVTRLRADGIELTSIGDPYIDRDPHASPGPQTVRGAQAGPDPRSGPDAQADPEQAETVRLEDPVLGRYGKLTVRAGRVADAIMLGLPDAAAQVIHLADRGGPVPSDLLSLLLGRARPPAGRFSPADAAASLPEDAVVCRCNTVTKAALVAAWRRGARSVPDLAAATRAATGCGSCQDDVGGFVSWLADEHDDGAGGPGCGDAAADPSEVPAEEVIA
jgi:assimilatory nitrate reductase electron transfer subunit